MIIIDSSFWIELFIGSETGKIISCNENFLSANYLLPVIVVTEIYNKLLRDTDSYNALLFTTQMKSGTIVNIDFELALNAAIIGKKYKLPLAESIIYIGQF